MPKKKSVIFVSYSMGIGGVEKALLGVINKFYYEGWNITLALIRKEGEFMKYLPQSINIVEIEGFKQIRPIIHAPMKQTVLSEIRKGNLFKSLRIAYYLLCYKLEGGAIKLYNYAFQHVPVIKEVTYDLAVSFAGPDSFIDLYVNNCVNAKEKWGWIHFDVTKFGIDKSIIRHVYKNYSRINIVSNIGKEKFDKIFSQFSDKTFYTPNIIDKSSILEMAKEQSPMLPYAKKLNLLTVGRISKEKGQYKALHALEILINSGFTEICWWFVGTGTDFERCRDYAEEKDLNKYVKFVGATPNPYPYLADCDIYVQPSEHEGFCITLAEAKLFNKPIVATDFTGAREQLIDYNSAWLISDHSSEDMAIKIEELFRNVESI